MRLFRAFLKALAALLIVAAIIALCAFAVTHISPYFMVVFGLVVVLVYLTGLFYMDSEYKQ
jgi:hypothetical protein